MRTSIDDPPEELLEMTFMNFVSAVDESLNLDNIKTLATISLTSKTFHRIVEPLLYRNIPGLIEGMRQPTGTHLVMKPHLLRTLKRRPTLGTYVKTLHVRAFYTAIPGDKWDDYARREQYERAHLVLQLMPNLERYAMEKRMQGLTPDKMIEENFGGHVGLNSLSKLRRLDATVVHSSLLDLIPIFELPSLEFVKVGNRRNLAREGNEALVKQWKELQSSVKVLHITNGDINYGGRWDTPPAAHFQLLAHACPKLKSFGWIQANQVAPESISSLYEMFLKALKPQILDGSLCHFELKSRWGKDYLVAERHWPSIYGLWNDPNVKLESLKIDLDLLFQEKNGNLELRGPGIPQSLRHLTVIHNDSIAE